MNAKRKRESLTVKLMNWKINNKSLKNSITEERNIYSLDICELKNWIKNLNHQIDILQDKIDHQNSIIESQKLLEKEQIQIQSSHKSFSIVLSSTQNSQKMTQISQVACKLFTTINKVHQSLSKKDPSYLSQFPSNPSQDPHDLLISILNYLRKRTHKQIAI